MRDTYFIQRLKRPQNVINPFSFGGGGGGFRPGVLETLATVFSFDYMGSAEFELGAVPKALDKIKQYCQAGKVATGSVQVREGKSIDYLCEVDAQAEVARRIQQLYDDEHRFQLKERCRLQRSVDGQDQRIVGWLELDNGYMFFSDREMYQAVRKLFGLPQENAVVVKLPMEKGAQND